MNEWNLSYALVLAVLMSGVYRRRRRSGLVVWRRVIAWLVLGAICATLVWGVLGCALLVDLPLEGRNALQAHALCLVGSAFWSAMVVAAALPIYGLALALYALGDHRERVPRLTLVALLLAAAAPVGVVLCYGYAFPLHGTLADGLSRAAAPALIGFLAAVVGLAAPRLLLQRLSPGSLWHADAA